MSAFKKRHGIHNLHVQGESLSADSACVSSYVDGLQIQLDERGMCAEQVYNADETALYWKAVPRKTLVAAFEQSAPGRKESKQRVSILLCCNATGSHKLKPLLIGKYRNPRFLNMPIDSHCLPVIYHHQSNMWMTQEIFAEWFHNYFVPSVKDHLIKLNLPLKAHLLVDNCSAHPRNLTSDDGAICCEFLPPNVTSLLQPLDCGVIETAKR